MSAWKKHRSVIFILLLLCGEITWLLSNLKVISLPFISRDQKVEGRRQAGYVIQARQDLKKRGPNSLVWENSQEKDLLYYHDSILTLSQSSATLYLNDQTELRLSENTLVSLEEPENQSSSEIRLRFSKGDLRARNPYARTQFREGDWTVTLEKGTDLSLRKENGIIEVEVHEGKALLDGTQGQQIIDGAEIFRIEEGQTLNKVTKTQALAWRDKESLRRYTVSEVDLVPLSWEGDAKAVVVQRVGQADETVPLRVGQTTTELPLPLGHFRLRLQNETGVSDPLSVEVWKAPHILPRQPLPRDRLKTFEEHEFIWSLLPEVKEYRLKLFNADRSFEKVISQQLNFMQIRFDTENDLIWQVEGIDHEGHAIPSFYDNSLFIRHDPLQAPKLKVPLLRKPANKRDGAWLIRILLPVARADEGDFEALFEWEKVEGADQYTIEISANPDFRNAEIIKTVKEPQFIWRNFSQRKYYWRVAAGTKKGRMGIFSDPVELKFHNLTIGEEIDSNGVRVKKMEKAPVKKTAPMKEQLLEAAAPVLANESSLSSAPSVDRVLHRRASLAWAPGYHMLSRQGERESRFNLSGGVPLSMLFDLNMPTTEDRELAIVGSFSQQTWKATPASEFPFQDDLKVTKMTVQVLRGSRQSRWRWGASLANDVIATRVLPEVIGATPIWLIGGRGEYLNGEPGPQSWRSGFSLVTSGREVQLHVDTQMKRTIFQSTRSSWFVGFQMSGLYQYHRQGSGTEVGGMLLFGLDFKQTPPNESGNDQR